MFELRQRAESEEEDGVVKTQTGMVAEEQPTKCSADDSERPCEGAPGTVGSIVHKMTTVFSTLFFNDDSAETTAQSDNALLERQSAKEWLDLAARSGHAVAAKLSTASDSSSTFSNKDAAVAGRLSVECTAQQDDCAANGLMANSNSNSNADADAEAERLAAWVRAGGGTINGLDYAAVGAGGGRGLVATRALAKDELLISVPSSLWFSTPNIMQHSTAKAIFRDPKVVEHCGPPEAGDLWMLILALEHERYQPGTCVTVPFSFSFFLGWDGGLSISFGFAVFLKRTIAPDKPDFQAHNVVMLVALCVCLMTSYLFVLLQIHLGRRILTH